MNFYTSLFLIKCTEFFSRVMPSSTISPQSFSTLISTMVSSGGCKFMVSSSPTSSMQLFTRYLQLEQENEYSSRYFFYFSCKFTSYCLRNSPPKFQNKSQILCPRFSNTRSRNLLSRQIVSILTTILPLRKIFSSSDRLFCSSILRFVNYFNQLQHQFIYRNACLIAYQGYADIQSGLVFFRLVKQSAYFEFIFYYKYYLQYPTFIIGISFASRLRMRVFLFGVLIIMIYYASEQYLIITTLVMYQTPVKQTLRHKQPAHAPPTSYSNYPYISTHAQSRNNKHHVYLQKPGKNHELSVHPSANEMQTKKIDSIQIDYKEKAFEFMRKNTELELNMRQARLDIQNLENQVQRFSGIVKQILGAFGVHGLDAKKSYSIIENIEQNQKNIHQSYFRKQLELFKNIMSESMRNQMASSKQKQNEGQLYSTLPKNHPYIEPIQLPTTDYKNMSTERTHFKSDRNFNQTSYQELAQDENEQECQCEEHYSTIINQYKNIIQNQHSNIMKKDKTSKMLKKQVQEYKNIVEELKKNISRHENQISEMEAKLQEMEQGKKQDEENKVNQKQKEAKLEARIQELQKMLQDLQKAIQDKSTQNQQISKQKQKIKLKYKQQIVHFEEMEKLVEEKLIQVEYQMNFYKKERLENFQKIRRLQGELKEYKAAQQKKYYSFGELQRDYAVQVQQKELSSQTNSKGQFVVSQDKSVTIKNNKRQHQLSPSDQNNGDDDDVPQLKEVQTNKIYKDPWQIQCYQQSIKTLLLENNRLKSSLLKLYKKGMGKNDEIDEEVSVELKMLLATIGEQAAEDEQEDEKQAEVVENAKKGRRFIKEV